MSAIRKRIQRLGGKERAGCPACREVTDFRMYTMHHQPRPPHLFCCRCGRDCTEEIQLCYDGSPLEEAAVFPGPAFDPDLSFLSSRPPYREVWDAPPGFVRQLVQERRMPWNP